MAYRNYGYIVKANNRLVSCNELWDFDFKDIIFFITSSLLTIIPKDEEGVLDIPYWKQYENFYDHRCHPLHVTEKRTRYFKTEKMFVTVKVLDKFLYKARICHNNDVYECIYGYGICAEGYLLEECNKKARKETVRFIKKALNKDEFFKNVRN